MCIRDRGKSGWKNFRSLNKFSVGIELVNPGHDFGYRKFSKKQIHSLKKISKKLIAKYNIIDSNIVGHSDIAPLRKKDPGEKFPWKELASSKIGIPFKSAFRIAGRFKRREISGIDLSQPSILPSRCKEELP